MNGSPDSASNADSPWKWLGGKWTLSALCVVLFIVAIYVEEDWRGEAEWNKAQTEIAAAGESLDPNKFIPPPAPDDQNFGALPIFEVDVTPGWGADAVGMKRAFAKIPLYNLPDSPERRYEREDLPFPGYWRWGQEPDLPAIHKQLAVLCDYRMVSVPRGASSSTMFGKLCPVLAELRAADQTHPLCRFNIDYLTQPTLFMGASGAAGSTQLVRVLSYEERLALLYHQPDLAFADLKIGWKVNSGLRKEGFLLPGLFALVGQGIQLEMVAQGLAQHVWNKDQLVELESDLGSIDDLAEARLCLRGNVALVYVPSTDFFKKHRSQVTDLLFGPPFPGRPSPPLITQIIVTTVGMLLPDGWFDEYKAQEARLNLIGAAKVIDPEKRRAFPEQVEKAMRLIEPPKSSGLSQDILSRNLRFGLDQMERYVYAQVQIDEARIACRLERYRLDHRQYPSSLTELTPVYGDALPRDVMNGEPYHYKWLGDGTYLLYSVGWDQVDDGGKVGTSDYRYYKNDPDWVWDNHPEATKTK